VSDVIVLASKAEEDVPAAQPMISRRTPLAWSERSAVKPMTRCPLLPLNRHCRADLGVCFWSLSGCVGPWDALTASSQRRPSRHGVLDACRTAVPI